VDLPVMPPVKPMLSKSGTLEQALVLLDEGHGQIEPKWDAYLRVALKASEKACVLHCRAAVGRAGYEACDQCAFVVMLAHESEGMGVHD
jgi:hypothetical protein